MRNSLLDMYFYVTIFFETVLNRCGRHALVLQCNHLKYAGKSATLEVVAVVFKTSVLNVLSALERSK